MAARYTAPFHRRAPERRRPSAREGNAIAAAIRSRLPHALRVEPSAAALGRCQTAEAKPECKAVWGWGDCSARSPRLAPGSARPRIRTAAGQQSGANLEG